jgi:hypothetical protein
MERELIAIGCYLDNDIKKNIIKRSIEILNKDFDIMLVSHYPIPTNLQNIVNYVIYDYNNELNPGKGYYAWFGNDDLYYERHYENSTNPSFAVYRLISNVAHSARGLGYEYFFYMEGDLGIDVRDIIKLSEIANKTKNENKLAYFFKSYTDTGFWDCQLFFSNTKFLIQHMPIYNTFRQFEQHCNILNCESVIEYYLYNNVYLPNLDVITMNSIHPNKYLTNSIFNLTGVNTDLNYKSKPYEIEFVKNDGNDLISYLILIVKQLDTNRVFLLYHNIGNVYPYIDIYINQQYFINTKDNVIIFKELNFSDDELVLSIRKGDITLEERNVIKADIMNSKDFIKFY